MPLRMVQIMQSGIQLLAAEVPVVAAKTPATKPSQVDGHGCLVLKGATIDPAGDQIVCAMNPAIKEEVVQKMLDLQSTSN